MEYFYFCNYHWHILYINFHIFPSSFETFVPFSLSLPLNGILSIDSFGPGFEIMFRLELFVTLLPQKSD